MEEKATNLCSKIVSWTCLKSFIWHKRELWDDTTVLILPPVHNKVGKKNFSRLLRNIIDELTDKTVALDNAKSRNVISHPPKLWDGHPKHPNVSLAQRLARRQLGKHLLYYMPELGRFLGLIYFRLRRNSPAATLKNYLFTTVDASQP